MEYFIESEGLVIQLPASLGSEEATELVDLYKKKRNGRHKNIILDASVLTYINSMAIGAMLEIYKDAKFYDTEVRLRQLSGEPLNILNRVGLSHLFIIEKYNKENTISFEYKSEVVGDTKVLHLSGMMYSSSDGRKFSEAIDDAFDTSHLVLLNVENLKYLDKNGIEMLVQKQDKAKEQGKELRVCTPNDIMKDIFKHVKLNNYVNVCESVSQALSI